jgi:uncharacterized protein
MRFTEKGQEKRMPKKDIVVFYHADCTDGFTAAWVAHRKFGDKALYMPFFHDDEPPQVKNKEIYLVDMVFNDTIMKRLMQDNEKVTAIDHHISRKDMILSTHNPLYATDHSGCTLAWQYFFPGEPVPQFLLYVEDVDLWAQKFKNSKTLYYYLDLFEYDFKTWSSLIADFEIPEKKEEMLSRGEMIYIHTMKIIDRNILKNAKLVEFEGYKVYAVNTDHSASDIGSRLCEKHPPLSIMWHERKDGVVLVSLRGVGDIDCSAIAAKYGGGGHKLSCGFRLKSIKDIPWKEV